MKGLSEKAFCFLLSSQLPVMISLFAIVILLLWAVAPSTFDSVKVLKMLLVFTTLGIGPAAIASSYFHSVVKDKPNVKKVKCLSVSTHWQWWMLPNIFELFGGYTTYFAVIELNGKGVAVILMSRRDLVKELNGSTQELKAVDLDLESKYSMFVEV